MYSQSKRRCSLSAALEPLRPMFLFIRFRLVPSEATRTGIEPFDLYLRLALKVGRGFFITVGLHSELPLGNEAAGRIRPATTPSIPSASADSADGYGSSLPRLLPIEVGKDPRWEEIQLASPLARLDSRASWHRIVEKRPLDLFIC